MHLVAVLAGFFAPYSYREQNRATPRAAPTNIRFIDDEGRWHARPFIYAAGGGDVVPLSFFVRGSSYELFGFIRSDLHLFGVDESHRVFVLGTDALGRDYFSRLLYGGQLSLTAGLLAAVLALATALVLGAAAGYGGRALDGVIMWTGDVFLSLPWIYMLLAARSVSPARYGTGRHVPRDCHAARRSRLGRPDAHRARCRVERERARVRRRGAKRGRRPRSHPHAARASSDLFGACDSGRAPHPPGGLHARGGHVVVRWPRCG